MAHTGAGIEAQIRARLEAAGVAPQQPYAGGMIDAVELITQCGEGEVWRFLVWLAAKARAAREQVNDGEGIGQGDRCDVISGAAADVASVCGIIRRVRREWAAVKSEGREFLLRAIATDKLVNRN